MSNSVRRCRRPPDAHPPCRCLPAALAADAVWLTSATRAIPWRPLSGPPRSDAAGRIERPTPPPIVRPTSVFCFRTTIVVSPNTASVRPTSRPHLGISARLPPPRPYSAVPRSPRSTSPRRPRRIVRSGARRGVRRDLGLAPRAASALLLRCSPPGPAPAGLSRGLPAPASILRPCSLASGFVPARRG